MDGRRKRKRSLLFGSARALLAILALGIIAWGDVPDPENPGVPPRVATGDRPETGDYRHQRRAVALLPPLEVVVTAYSPTECQTDSLPFVTATNTHPRPGVIALSRDLIRAFNPTAPFRFGDRVHLAGIGEFIVEDTMHERWNRRADIFFESTDDAIRWGKRRLAITLVEPEGGSSGSVRREASAPSE
ncbi:MAG: 3D domain-containing protein [Candidatus Eisenbacteria bacterium]|nr:3D domain-containing protein [Candidatus Eisenbacteria bacterium]